jgi:hypothetical protein
MEKMLEVAVGEILGGQPGGREQAPDGREIRPRRNDRSLHVPPQAAFERRIGRVDFCGLQSVAHPELAAEQHLSVRNPTSAFMAV